MKALRVRVEQGRIYGEAPPGLPEGELDLCLAEPDDDMSEEELAELNETLDAAFASLKAGRFRPASDVIERLRTNL